jgi:hypothetical protein
MLPKVFIFSANAEKLVQQLIKHNRNNALMVNFGIAKGMMTSKNKLKQHCFAVYLCIIIAELRA